MTETVADHDAAFAVMLERTMRPFMQSAHGLELVRNPVLDSATQEKVAAAFHRYLETLPKSNKGRSDSAYRIKDVVIFLPLIYLTKVACSHRQPGAVSQHIAWTAVLQDRRWMHIRHGDRRATETPS